MSPEVMAQTSEVLKEHGFDTESRFLSVQQANTLIICDTNIWDEVLRRMERKCITTMGDGYCSSAVSTTLGSLTWFPHKRIHKDVHLGM